MRIIRERGKKTKGKKRHEWKSVCSWKNNNVNNYTYWKKKRTKEKDKNLLLTKKKNYKNSDIPHCSHNCNKTNQHIVILLENLCSLKFFHVLQDSFKGPHLMEQGYKVNTPANYIHAYNESWFFIIRLLNVISITKIDRILNRSQQATRKIIGGNCKSTKRLS